MEVAVLVGVAVVCLIAAVTIFAMRDASGTKEVAIEISKLRGDMRLYASKQDLDSVRNIAADAMARAVVMSDEQKAFSERMKKSEDEFTALKTRVENMQMQVNKNHNAMKALPPKVVHVKHTYDSPMQVDLNYPTKVQTKAKGRGALLEKAGVR